MDRGHQGSENPNTSRYSDDSRLSFIPPISSSQGLPACASRWSRIWTKFVGTPAPIGPIQISSPPIPVDRILEDVLDLSILWDTIPEEPGQSILAGLDPNNKTVVFNELRLALIEETPGLYNTVLGHESGHWEAHVDPALLDQPAPMQARSLAHCEEIHLYYTPK